MSLQLLLVLGGLIMQIFMLIIQWKTLNLQRQKCNEIKKEETANNASSTFSRKTKSDKEANLCLMAYGDDEDGWSKNNSKKIHKKKCFECDKEGHLRPDCPTIQKKQKKGSNKSLKGKKKNKTYIDWDETGTSSTTSDIDQDNMAFTVKETTSVAGNSDCEVSSSNSKGHDYEELQEAFTELFEEAQKLSSKNKKLRAQMKIHVEDCKNFEEIVIELRKENSDLKKKVNDISKNDCSKCKMNSHLVCENCKTFEEKVSVLEKENVILKNKVETSSSNASKAKILLNKPCENCKALSQKLDHLENDLARFSKAKTDLNSLLKVQKTMNDKTGLGYKNVSKKGKKKTFQKPRNQSVLPSITCNYCMHRGHTSFDCNFKKYAVPQGHYIWVKRAAKGISNTYGPKTIWVPKSS